MPWYLAPSLQVLRAEVDTRWPRRDRASDGTIGDAAHAAGTSDHNPNSRESVNAIDIDKDGVDVAAILAAAERHPSVHYWIFNREIADRDNGFRRQRYTGSNPHDKHLHISIRQTRSAEQDRRSWGLLAGEDDDVSAEDVIEGMGTPAAWQSTGVGRWAESQGMGDTVSSRALLEYSLVDNKTLLQQQAVLLAAVQQLAGRDLVDEPAIVAGVLAGLSPESIAAAIPLDLAVRVADELARRLGTPQG